MTAPDGEPLDLSIAHFIAASTPQLHAQLVALLRDA
jgi:hypothetical protein